MSILQLNLTNVGSKSNFDHDHHGGSSKAFHFIPARNVMKHFHGFDSYKTPFVGGLGTLFGTLRQMLVPNLILIMIITVVPPERFISYLHRT